MVATRRTRILILTALAFTIGLLLFAYPGHQDTAKILDKVEEKVRLSGDSENVDSKLSQQAPAAAKDLTVGDDGAFDPEKEYMAILEVAPVVIFSKSKCPHSKFVKDLLLKAYSITPTARVVELDLHPHGADLQAYIGKVTGRRTVPNVHIVGTSRGGGDEIRALHEANELSTSFAKWAGESLRIKKIPVPSTN
ncbi:hypothetical protein NADFUDRAFT_46118 [Nadsonia fulvescens var. elongata DSM 6958]|uniref:Glutaredoxin domain-containing protein n=1 Tax=Nadsonia fulvescens var. elongata DSM 6958 TaxID=857566 RepID=A0A1E3PPG4_9ASCO|nr:hypothetical protein NADFUDRAFT_46118 [Nadsonia fulvescens var. elongata DSM 6958]